MNDVGRIVCVNAHQDCDRLNEITREFLKGFRDELPSGFLEG
jgi:hypothetical protein